MNLRDDDDEPILPPFSVVANLEKAARAHRRLPADHPFRRIPIRLKGSPQEWTEKQVDHAERRRAIIQTGIDGGRASVRSRKGPMA